MPRSEGNNQTSKAYVLALSMQTMVVTSAILKMLHVELPCYRPQISSIINSTMFPVDDQQRIRRLSTQFKKYFPLFKWSFRLVICQACQKLSGTLISLECAKIPALSHNLI